MDITRKAASLWNLNGTYIAGEGQMKLRQFVASNRHRIFMISGTDSKSANILLMIKFGSFCSIHLWQPLTMLIRQTLVYKIFSFVVRYRGRMTVFWIWFLVIKSFLVYAFTKMDLLQSQHGQLITSVEKCGMVITTRDFIWGVNTAKSLI